MTVIDRELAIQQEVSHLRHRFDRYPDLKGRTFQCVIDGIPLSGRKGSFDECFVESELFASGQGINNDLIEIVPVEETPFDYSEINELLEV